MIEIEGSALYQWDTKRTVSADVDIDKIHLSNPGDAYAAIMDGSTVTIPDYLLQSGKPINAYAVRDGVTVESKTFPVHKRERPEDYVYDEDRRNFIYELIADAEAATQGANEAAGRANEAAEAANNAAQGLEANLQEVEKAIAQNKEAIESHADNKDNPHEITCEKIGAATVGYVEDVVSTKASPEDVVDEVQHALDVEGLIGHTQAENPHEITCDKIGAATKNELADGVDEAKSYADYVGHGVLESAEERVSVAVGDVMVALEEQIDFVEANFVAEAELADKVAEKIAEEYNASEGPLLRAIDMVAQDSGSIATVHTMYNYDILVQDHTGKFVRNVPTIAEIAVPQYEFIKSVTTTEVQKNVIFADINLDAFVLFANIPADSSLAGACGVIFNKGGTTVWQPYVSNAISASNATHFAAYGRNENGLAFLEYTNATAVNTTSQKYINRAPFYVEGTTPFTKVSISCANGFPIGTKVELYGIPKL